MSIRARFTLTVVAIVAATAALFATLSILALDRTLRSNFTSRLHSAAQAIGTTVDVHRGRPSLDPDDLNSLGPLRANLPFALLDASGRVVSGDRIPRDTTGLQIAGEPVIRDGITHGRIVVWQPDGWIDEFDRTAALISFGIALLLVVLGSAVSRRVAQRVLAPADEIASLAERIEAKDLSLRLHAEGRDELGRLCASFDRMLDRLEAAFSRERRFVADASHELRAPLAVLRAETELALRRERTDAEYRAALESIAREALRLQELVDELLDTARSEIETQRPQTVDANDVLRSLRERIAPAAATRGIRVRVEGDAVVAAQANRSTLERALLAIAHNAINYGRDDGTIWMHARRHNGHIRIEIADDGPGFNSEALAHATERFWRGDAGRPRGGTGLGLAIARTIVEANRGQLTLANSERGGALVVVELNAAT